MLVFVHWIIIQCHTVNIVADIVLLCPLGALSVGACVSLTYSTMWIFKVLSYFFDTKWCPRHILHVCYPRLSTSHFSKEPSSLCWLKSCWDWMFSFLRRGGDHCFSALLVDIKRKFYLCMLIHIYISILSISICICVKLNLSLTEVSKSHHYHEAYSSLLPLLACGPSLCQWETWFPSPAIPLPNCSINRSSPVCMYRNLKMGDNFIS